MQGVLKDDAQLLEMFSDNPSFSQWLAGIGFHETYRPGGPELEQGELVRGRGRQ